MLSTPLGAGDRIAPSAKEAIRCQLSKIVSSTTLTACERLQKFLEFIVIQHLEGNVGNLKEVSIAETVFGKSSNFNSRIETTVRSAASRLRTKLAGYYASEGREDPICIEVPKGHYVPRITVKSPREDSSRTTTEVAPDRHHSLELRAIGQAAVLVGREGEMGWLKQHSALVAAGRGRMLCVVAEPGIGKSALVETFLNDATDASDTFHAIGRCRQELERSEPYLPWLDALDELVSQDHSVAALMESVSPTWWICLRQRSPTPLPRETATVKREILTFLQRLSAQRPIVLFIDDLHWADRSSLDLVAYLGASLSTMRLLLIAAFRHSDLVLRNSPFLQIEPELTMRRVSERLTLSELSPDAIRSYLDQRFPNHAFSSQIQAWFNARSGGNPLCLTALAEQAVTQGWIVGVDQGWRAVTEPAQWSNDLPESVVGLISQKIRRLSETDQALLQVAGLAGGMFDAAVISRALNLDAVAVEERMDYLENRHRILVCDGAIELLKGIWTRCYRFAHPLYREALLKALGPIQRRRLSKPMAQSIIALHPEAARSMASNVARLLEEAGMLRAALSYYYRAALNAVQMSAYQQVLDLTRRATRLAQRAERNRWIAASEIRLLTLQAVAAANLGGWDTPALERLYLRAKQLDRESRNKAASIIVGQLYCTHVTTQSYVRGQRLANVLLRTVTGSRNAPAAVTATMTVGVTLLHRGQIVRAMASLREAERLCTQSRERPTFLDFPVPMPVAIACMLGRTLSIAGRTIEAFEKTLQAVQIAEDLQHDRTRTYALAMAADVAHLVGDVPKTLRWAEEAIRLATEHELRYEATWASCWRAWALARLGKFSDALPVFERCTANYHGPAATKILCHYAEALAKSGDLRSARRALDRAFEHVVSHGETYYQSELLRVQGELILRKANLTQDDLRNAERHFRAALNKSRRQGAKSFELRAAIGLAGLASEFRVDGADRARSELRQIFDDLRPYGETTDLAEARRLLAE